MDDKTPHRLSSLEPSSDINLHSDELKLLDLEMLEGLPLLLERLSVSQKEALFNATQLDESMLLQLSSKFIFAKSCEDYNSESSLPFVFSQSFQTDTLRDHELRTTVETPIEIQVKKVILTYLPIIIYMIGLIGNCLSFSVLVRRRMRRVSTYRYLAVLSVVDTIVLTLGLLQLWTGEVTGTSIRNYSDFSCKIVNAFGYTVSDLSVWLIIAVTVERFIAIRYPLKAATTCRSKTAVKVMAILLIVMILININFFWTTKIQVYETKRPLTLVLSDSGSVERCPIKYYTQKQCTAAEGYDFLVEKVWPWLDAIIYSFLPFVIIIILNSLIISRVVSARRKRCRMTTQLSASSLNKSETCRPQAQIDKSPRILHNPFSSKNPNNCCNATNENTDGRLTARQTPILSGSNRREANETNFMLSLMLLTISFAFLLMTLPMNIMLIINNIWNTSSSSSHDHHQWAKYQLASTITELLMYMNHSTNFFLYCATGQKFRIELKRMATGWQTCFSCSRMCRSRNWFSAPRQRDRQFDWSLPGDKVNKTIHDKTQVNQTIIMNIITSPLA